MARKTPKTKAGKKDKMSRVMKEYRQGVLKSGSKAGPRVKNRAQAIAIGLKESGQSKPQSGKTTTKSGTGSKLKVKLEDVQL